MSADYKVLIAEEYEAIEKVLSLLPINTPLSQFNKLECEGIASLLRQFYDHIEAVLKLSLNAKGYNIPKYSSWEWHRELLNIALREGIIPESTARELRRYVAFTRYVLKAYSHALSPKQIQPLVTRANDFFVEFRSNVDKTIMQLS